MPELPEIEFYRRLAERSALERTIVEVIADDEWFLKGDTTKEQLQQHLTGAMFHRAWRVGKLLLLDTDRADVLGLRFGMAGTLVVNDEQGVTDMQYGSRRNLPEWNRFTVLFADGGLLTINDPRRLGGVEFTPDLQRMGVDALSIDVNSLAGLTKSSMPLKAWLLDQSKVAGVGNLLADEILWRVGLDPARPANAIAPADVARLAGVGVETVQQLIDRGGSHRGDLMPERKRDGHCPKDGAALLRRTIGGRTTYWCPVHQV